MSAVSPSGIVNGALFLEIVRGAVALVMEVAVDDLHAGTRLLEDLDADSLALIEIVEVAEERLRAKGIAVLVDDSTLARLRTIDELVVALAAAANGRPHPEQGR